MLDYLRDLFGAQPILGTLISVFAALVASRIWAYWRRSGKYPPGPLGLPIIGYPPLFFDKELHKTLTATSKKYGDIFSVKFGQINAVVINNYDALKESGRKDEFSNRPPDFFHWSDSNTHIGVMSGKPWKEQRRFLLSTLRNVGMGKLKVEESIKEQIDYTVEQFKIRSQSETDINMRDILSPAINNIILSLICGKTYEANHEQNKMLSDYQFKLLEYFERSKLAYFFPLIRKLLWKYSGTLKDIRRDLMTFENVLGEEIKQRLKDPAEERPADYIEFFLKEIKRNSDEAGTTFTVPSLLGTAQVILMAGSETTRSTIEWTLLCLARNQLFQELVHKQIIEVLGTDGQVEWKDRERLVLVQALILEVSRFKTLVTLSDPHWTSEDTEVSGYSIPKDTFIILNLWAVHNDAEYWGDPENFRPERFLSKDFKSIVNVERVIPFGVGKRMCPGEKLAEVEVFLFITTLLQKLRFLPPENGFVCMDEMTVLTQMVVKPIIRVETRY